MTVCVAVCVHDGIVFAADSATSLVVTTPGGASSIQNVYRHGNKVFNLYKSLPVCAMTAGMGSLGAAPIQALAKDLRVLFRDPASPYYVDEKAYTIEQIAGLARRFLFEEKYKTLPAPPPAPHSLEFWIGGYSAGHDTHDLWKVTIENGACDDPIKICGDGGAGIFWGAQAQPIQRLVIGFDKSLEDALRAAGVDEAEIPVFLGMVRSRSEAPLCDAAMPIMDAIDLAEYLVDLTKRFYRFHPGADIVGGDTDIATITRHERFKWIKRKHYYPRELNVLETDHV